MLLQSLLLLTLLSLQTYRFEKGFVPTTELNNDSVA